MEKVKITFSRDEAHEVMHAIRLTQERLRSARHTCLHAQDHERAAHFDEQLERLRLALTKFAVGLARFE